MAKGQSKIAGIPLYIVIGIVVLLVFISVLAFAGKIKIPGCIGGGFVQCLQDIVLNSISTKVGPGV